MKSVDGDIVQAGEMAMLQDVGATLGFFVMVTASALLVMRRIQERDCEERMANKGRMQG